jgi:4-hydroxy-tetrahydrodipicolinate synthase
MVGCGTYSTAQTLENMKCAADLGAGSALVVTPYYNKPTQEGLYRHFAYLAEHSPIPLIVYNIQGRTSLNLKTETLRRLLPFPSIIGVKEGSGNLSQISEAIALKKTRPDFQVYASDDVWILPLMAMGGDGVISTVGNLLPQRIKELVTACKQGDLSRAQEIHLNLLPLFELTGIETNPIPIKAAMQLAGFAAGSPRLPLTPLDSAFLPIVKATVKGLL